MINVIALDCCDAIELLLLLQPTYRAGAKLWKQQKGPYVTTAITMTNEPLAHFFPWQIASSLY